MTNKDNQTQINKVCQVVIFRENHSKSLPASVFRDSLSFFASHGFKTTCFETSEQSYQLELRGLEYAVSLYSDIFCNEFYGQQFCDGSAQVNRVKVEIMKSLNTHNMMYCGMDLEHSNEGKDDLEIIIISSLQMHSRDAVMAKNIANSCENGHVLALVGADHYDGIIRNLKQNPLIDIRGYFIPEIPAKSYYDMKEIRESDENPHVYKPGNLLVIDMHKNPDLNATAIVLQDYSEYLAGQHQEATDEL
jgi:hypothetical protein